MFLGSRRERSSRGVGKECAMSKQFKRFVVIGALVALGFGFTLAEGQKAEKYSVSGREVTVYNLAGTVTIENYDGDVVQVLLSRGGTDAAKIKVDTDIDDYKGILRITTPGQLVTYPQVAAQAEPVFVRDDGSFAPSLSGREVKIVPEGTGLNAWADLTILVPKKVTLTVNLGAGKIEAKGLVSPLMIGGINGQVTIADHTGGLKVKTVAAAVSVTGGSGKVAVETKTGNITLGNVQNCKTKVWSESGKIEGDVAAAKL